jgi:ferredoxin-thioredoxin reductase catalytic subunit
MSEEEPVALLGVLDGAAEAVERFGAHFCGCRRIGDEVDDCRKGTSFEKLLEISLVQDDRRG